MKVTPSGAMMQRFVVSDNIECYKESSKRICQDSGRELTGTSCKMKDHNKAVLQ